MKITHGPSPAPTNACSVPGGQWTKSHLDQEQARAGEDEEVLLVRLVVVSAARLTGLQHGDRESKLWEGDVVALDDARVAEHVVRHPRGVRDVDDEPAVGDRREPAEQLLESRFVGHSL
jgi:hypothetical protein